MAGVQTPGVYFQSLAKQRPVSDLVRSDIAAFLGYARQGPADLPIQLHSWRQFLTVFGEPYPVGYLADAVKGFFENGGASCYVTRVTDGTARAAALSLAKSPAFPWVFGASYLLTVQAVQVREGEVPDASLQLAGEQAASPSVKRQANPGQWGNALSLTVDRDATSNAWTVPGILEQGYVTEVESITGLAAGSIVQLHQADGAADAMEAVARIERVDTLRHQVYWHQSLSRLGFDLLRPIRLESVEFSVQVALNNRIVETFSHLAVHPDHERHLAKVLHNESLFVDAEAPPVADPSIYMDPDYWPPRIFNRPLAGGTDGLTGVSAEHYLQALGTLEKLDDIGLLATPDLVLRAGAPVLPPSLSTVNPPDCRRLDEVPKGVLFGRVVSLPEGAAIADEGGATAVAGVTVTYAAGARQQRSAADGTFRFENIETGLITLRFEKAGFEIEERMTLVQAQATAEPVEFYLKPLLLPPAIADNDVLRVQQAMLAQGEAGLYRFALLDPPQAEMKLDAIRGWRQKLGDSAYGGLYFPWLGVPRQATEGGPLKWVPPSGHMAGVIARTDRAEGVHRAPANVPLRDVKRLAVEVDDARQGILNPEGINCIRSFAGHGLLPYGARTLSSEAQWRYLNVRRLVSVLEKTLENTLQWAVFESNNTLLRQAVTYNIGALLNRLWRRGALAGNKPAAAYAVKCDEDNNPQGIRDAGQLIAEVAVAPSVPYEFIVFRLGKTLEAIEVSE